MSRPAIDPPITLEIVGKIRWDLLDPESFPPVNEWTQEDWDDAVLLTALHHEMKEDERTDNGQTYSFEEVLDRLGFTQEDLDNASSDDDG